MLGRSDGPNDDKRSALIPHDAGRPMTPSAPALCHGNRDITMATTDATLSIFDLIRFESYRTACLKSRSAGDAVLQQNTKQA